MKRTVIFLLLIFSSLSIFSQEINQVTLDSRGNKMLLGPTTKSALQVAPFNSWFDKNYEDYLENEKVIERKGNLFKYLNKPQKKKRWSGISGAFFRMANSLILFNFLRVTASVASRRRGGS